MPSLAARTFKQQRPQLNSRLSPLHSWCGQGEFTDFEHNGKKKKTTQATDQWLDWTQPGKLSGAHCGATAVFGYNRVPSLYIQRITEGTN